MCLGIVFRFFPALGNEITGGSLATRFTDGIWGCRLLRTWAPGTNNRDERETLCIQANHPRAEPSLGSALSLGSASQGWQVTVGPLTRPTPGEAG